MQARDGRRAVGRGDGLGPPRVLTCSLASLTNPRTRSRCGRLMRGPILVSSRRGSPSFILWVCFTTSAVNLSRMSFCTNTLVPLQQTWGTSTRPSVWRGGGGKGECKSFGLTPRRGGPHRPAVHTAGPETKARSASLCLLNELTVTDPCDLRGSVSSRQLLRCAACFRGRGNSGNGLGENSEELGARA